MLYGNNSGDEIAYAKLFDQAERELGIRTVYAVADDPPPDRRNVHRGFIDTAMIEREVRLQRSHFLYLWPTRDGHAVPTHLSELGVSRSRIKVDYFPGFA